LASGEVKDSGDPRSLTDLVKDWSGSTPLNRLIREGARGAIAVPLADARPRQHRVQ
jgi:hypothetical protein